MTEVAYQFGKKLQTNVEIVVHVDEELGQTQRGELLDYLTAQLNIYYPDGKGDVRRSIDADLDEALDRLRVCINSVMLWKQDVFHYLHSEQNTIFLYYLANTIWRNRQMVLAR